MEHTPRNIVLQLGALIALYLSISFFLTLIFGLINLVYPIPSDSYWELERATESVRLGIAMLVVFFPTYLILTRLVNQYRRSEQGVYQTVTRWLIYLSLLIAGLVLLVSLVTTIYTFLNGDITTRFILKAGSVCTIIGITFYYYLLDVRGHWLKNEFQSKIYAVIVSVIVGSTVIIGFMNIGTPTEVRELKLDEEQVNDLRDIQWGIIEYLNTSSSTPASLAAIYSDTELALSAPEGRAPYTYESTNDGFKLCATFSSESKDERRRERFNTQPVKANSEAGLSVLNPDNWNHDAGRYCFERIVK